MQKQKKAKEIKSIRSENESEEDMKEQFRSDFKKSLNYMKQIHKKWNYCYLQYKGILTMNEQYGEEYMKSIGLQINVPRTFMTIESIRPSLSGRDLDIDVEALNKEGRAYSSKARNLIRGEWYRSKSDWQKAEAEFNALLFGNGYLLSYYDEDIIETDVFDGYDDDGKVKFKEGEKTLYKGMRVKSLNPYKVFPDPEAVTDDPRKDGSWKYCYVYSIWDKERWKNYCKAMGYKNIGDISQGGILKDFDSVRKKIDSLYKDNMEKEAHTRQSDGSYKKTNQGVGDNNAEKKKIPKRFEDKVMVLERFEPDAYMVCSGSDWTVNHVGPNPYPDKQIPITVVRDYSIPEEFEGMGEPEVLRWQQYEENKIHNLSYLQVLMNTVQRYGVVEEHLKDPTEATMENPLEPIRLNYRQGISVSDAIQPLNQGSANNYPQAFMREAKQTGQAATGITDFFIGANTSTAGTATEANRLAQASSERIRQKIYQIEERDIIPILEHWLACIPQFYADDLDIPLQGDKEKFVKFIPYSRDKNKDADKIAEIATEEGLTAGSDINTIEKLYKENGYEDVIFVSDILNNFLIKMRTATAQSEREEKRVQYRNLVKTLSNVNIHLANVGQEPKFDILGIAREMMREYPNLIDDVDKFILDSNNPQKTGVPNEAIRETGQARSPEEAATGEKENASGLSQLLSRLDVENQGGETDNPNETVQPGNAASRTTTGDQNRQ